MGATVSYLLAWQYCGGEWLSGRVVGLLAAFGIISILFGRWEVFQGERAMMAPWLIRQRVVWLNCLYAFFFGGSYYVVVYYLPIYFQSIAGVTPTYSGIYNLPLLLATSVFMAVSGIAVSVIGIATPVMALAAFIATLGASLLYTLDLDSTGSKWICYQIVGGIGYGLGFQVPLMVVQGRAKPQDLAAVTAMVLCMQSSLLSYTFLALTCPSLQFPRTWAVRSLSSPRRPPSSTGYYFCYPRWPLALTRRKWSGRARHYSGPRLTRHISLVSSARTCQDSELPSPSPWVALASHFY